MKKIYIIFLLIISLGCTDKSIKPSEDSRSATDAFNTINIIREAYEKKDEAVLQNHMDTLLAENTIRGLLFEKAELVFTPRIVKITDSSVKVNFNWRGSWWLSKDKKLENGGVADLVFHKETMRLIYIDGDNPFLTPLEN